MALKINNQHKRQQGLAEEIADAAAPASKMALSVIIILIADLLAVTLSGLAVMQIRNDYLPLLSSVFFGERLLEETIQLLWWYPLAFVFSLAYEKLYHKRLPFWIEVEWIIRASTLALLMVIFFIYLTGISHIVSRAFVVMTWMVALFFIPVARYYCKKLLLKLNIWACPLILVGDASTAALVSRALSREKTMGYHLVGYINGPKEEAEQAEIKLPPQNVPLLGPLSEAEQIIADNPVCDLIIAKPGLPADDLVDLTNRFQPLVNNIIIVPDLFGITLTGIEVAYFFEEQTMFLQIRNRLNSIINRMVKRLFDLSVGAVIFLVALPVLLFLALAIKLDSPGSAFFVQERIGQGGRTFKVIKFRTMYTDADQILTNHLAENEDARREWTEYQKLKKDDPRVTRVGRLLRRLSIDELPQLINILKNDMSLVGPRPYLPREKEQLKGWAHDILVTKPGLTGLWQVSGRNQLNFQSRLRLDSWYVKNWSIWLDLVFILKTFRVVFRSDGAY